MGKLNFQFHTNEMNIPPPTSRGSDAVFVAAAVAIICAVAWLSWPGMLGHLGAEILSLPPW